MQLSFLSQDDSCPSECTPRDQNSLRRSSATIYSPDNRKKRGRFFAIFGKSNAESTSIEPSHFEMSQDDSNQFPFSQFSQDFTDRLGGLSMKASQDNFSQSCEARSAIMHDGNSFPFGSNASSTTSHVNFKLNPPSTVKAPPHSRSRFNQNQSREVLTVPSSSSKVNYVREISNGAEMKGNAFENDCQRIIIPASIENPFLLTAADDKNGIKKSKQKKKPIVTSIWIGPYQERPRYATDFEHIRDLGEGTFSTVFCAKKRLDGTLYAVKRVKKKISSENEGKLIVRESCALASLMNCPYMVRYFGCWIDNGHLHIQTEYCDKGSLDCYVMSLNHRTLDPLIPDNKNINFNHNNDNDEKSTSQIINSFDNEYDNKNDESNQNNTHNNTRKDLSNEIKNDMNFIENKTIFVDDDSQNDGIFSVQKDEIKIDNDKENEENKYGHKYEMNSKYNNEDDDDNEFLIEDNDHENNNHKNSNYDDNNDNNYDYDNKDNHDSNHNNDNLLKSENDPQLRYSDAIFSVGCEDSRNSDSYSCFSDSNSNNNNYELKYNNKAREYNIKDDDEKDKYENLVRNSDDDTQNLENCISKKEDDDDDDDDDMFQSTNFEENGEQEEKVEEELKFRDVNHDNDQNVDEVVKRGGEREGENGKREGEGEDNMIEKKKLLNGVVNENLAWVILHSMASALQYMHSKGMAHLDLRPANIFITQNTQNYAIKENVNSVEEKTVSDLIFEDAYVLRLGDLGHACMYNETNWIEGESRYCSLELIVSDDGQPLDLRYADMFSLGASVYELCLGRELGSGDSKEWHSIRDGILSDTFISTYSPSLVRFVKTLLHPTPTLRPSARDTVTLTSATLIALRQNHSYLDNTNTTLNSLKVESEVVRGAARTSSQQYLPPRSSSPVCISSITTSTSIAPGASEPCKKGPQPLFQKPAKRPFAHLFPAEECPMST